MPIDLKVKMQESAQFSKALRSRTFESLSQEQTDEILGMMGEVMSLRKLNRKVLVLATIQYHMEIGEALSAEAFAQRCNQIIQPRNALSSGHIGGIMVVMEKWGFIKRHRNFPTATFEYIRVK
jgi:hypothetical protein